MTGGLALVVPEAGWAVNAFLVLLVALVPVMLGAVALARRGRIHAHQRAMKASFLLFVAALLAFEASVRLDPDMPPLPWTELAIHLVFAVPCFVLWGWQVATGRRAYTHPRPHRLRGYALVALLLPTVATGIWVYTRMF